MRISKPLILHMVVTLSVAVVVLALPVLAHADYGQPPWDAALQTLVDYMTGTTARLLSILAVAAIGFLAIAGRITLHAALSVVLGIAIIFGAASIVNLFGK